MSSVSPSCTLGALPSRFRRARVLIVGCGDVGQRVARELRGASPDHPRVRLLALTSSAQQVAPLRALGITPLRGNLDSAASLRRLAGLATRVLHLAPPPGQGEGDADWWRDPRTVALARALRLRSLPDALVYASTSGVYGDCGGAWVTEARAVAPGTPRAQRRVDAERALRHLGRAGVRTSILRVPGIYAPDREGGTPEKMGDYFDLAADLYGLPRPPRLPRSTAQAELPLTLLSFMGESRRLDNTRLKRELRLRLRYPTVAQGLRS